MPSTKSRVHPKYKTKYRVGNWADYDRSLVGRGNLTFWLSPDAIRKCDAQPTRCRRGQRKYSGLAIGTALILRLLFRLPLRQVEGCLRSLFDLMGLALDVPDHTTLSLGGKTLQSAGARRSLCHRSRPRKPEAVDVVHEIGLSGVIARSDDVSGRRSPAIISRPAPRTRCFATRGSLAIRRFFNLTKPYCCDCWQARWADQSHQVEKCCHRCGTEFETDLRQPLCGSCGTVAAARTLAVACDWAITGVLRKSQDFHPGPDEAGHSWLGRWHLCRWIDQQIKVTSHFRNRRNRTARR